MSDSSFAPPASQLGTPNVGTLQVAAYPTAGQGLALDANGKIPASLLSTTTIVSGTRTSSVATSGTTFATGSDLLSTALSFSATGSSNYLVIVGADYQTNSVAAGQNVLHVNLDGADVGFFNLSTLAAAGNGYPCTAIAPIVAPSAGAHTLNVRLRVQSGGGTATVAGGAGTAGNGAPIVVALIKL